MYNERDEIIVELLRRTPYRLVDLRDATRGVIKSEYSLLHRLALLEASGRISSERHPEHKETIYTLSETEAEKKNTDAQTSAKPAHNEEHNVL
jgi:DNA-binding HxlR family transcriptional regulator